MKVLHVVTDQDRRGAQVYASALRDAMDLSGHEGRVVAIRRGGGEVTVGDEKLPDGIVRPFWALRRAARDHDISVAHGSFTLDWMSVAARRRFVYRSIGDPRYWGSTRARRLKTGALLRTTRGVVVYWAAAADAFAEMYRYPRERIAVIPRLHRAVRSSIGREERQAARVRLCIDPVRPTVAFVGALSEEKNVEALVSSLESLPEAQLIVVGDGPLRASLEERSRTALGSRARFLGQVADVSSALAAADVLALPSLTEGSPGVILEAAELGIATVATDVGGVRELIDEGATGYLVPPRNDDALGERLQHAISDSARLGDNARRRLEQAHHPAVVVARWAEFLQRAMA